MSRNLYLIVSGLIFLLVSGFHLFRIVYQWPIIVGSRIVPYWLSLIGCPVSLGYFLWAVWLLSLDMNGRHRHSE
jgi:hypothetical protein